MLCTIRITELLQCRLCVVGVPVPIVFSQFTKKKKKVEQMRPKLGGIACSRIVLYDIIFIHTQHTATRVLPIEFYSYIFVFVCVVIYSHSCFLLPTR